MHSTAIKIDENKTLTLSLFLLVYSWKKSSNEVLLFDINKTLIAFKYTYTKLITSKEVNALPTSLSNGIFVPFFMRRNGLFIKIKL